MKQIINKQWIGFLGLSLSLHVSAESILMPTITIEGQGARPDQIAVTPESGGGALDSAVLLKRVPGGNVNSNGPLTNIPQYRGLFGNRLGVQLNGISVQEVGPNAMDTRTSTVPKSLVRSIKVHRGIAPVSAGMETIGGAIEINSRRSEFSNNSTPKISGFANSGFSSVDTGRYFGGLMSLSNDTHRFHVGGNTEKGNDYRFKDNQKVRPSEYKRDVISVGYGLRPNEKHEISLDYDYKDTGNTGTPSLPMDIGYVRTHLGSFGYQGTLTNNLDVKFNGFFNRGDHLMSNNLLRPAPRPGGGNQRFRDATTTLESGGYNLHFIIPEFQNGHLLVGFDGDLAVNNSVISDPTNGNFFLNNFVNSTKERYSSFAEWNGEIMKDLMLEVGFRYTYIHMNTDRVSTSMANVMMPVHNLQNRFNNSDRSKNDHLFDASAVLRYAASNNLNLEIGVARKTRAPSFQERFLWIPLESTGGLADGRVYVGDTSLRPEKSYQVELGANLYGGGAYFTPRAFYRYVNDFIQGLPTNDALTNMVAGGIQPGGPGPLQFSNIDAHLWGVDFETGYTITDYLRVDGILSFVRGKRTNGNDNLYRIAPVNGRLSLTYERSDWLASLTYVGAMKQDKVAAFNGEQETSGYSILNVYTQYRPSFSKKTEGLTIAAGVNNIIDTKYVDHLNGINRASNINLAMGQRIPNPGRNVFVTLRYDW
ncbi:MAG: TonB-dependent receptor [Nitrosomonas sp.]|nr:TonB-dependent receptor [Nitrosomonas sp.]